MNSTTTPTRTCQPPGATSDTQAFKSVCAQLAKGLAIVTTIGPHGPTGMTVSAVNSLSIEPMLLLVCIRNGSRTLTGILQHQRFALNLLRDTHQNLSDAFSATRSDADKFAGVAHTPIAGAPVLTEALAYATCHLYATYPGGDHTIIVGAVTSTGRTHGEPLIWHRRAYRTLH